MTEQIPMSAEQFAAYIEDYISDNAQGIEVVNGDGVTLTLRVDGVETEADLGRLYRAYQRNPGQLEAVGRTFVRALGGAATASGSDSFDDLADRVMPVIRSLELLVLVRERTLPMLVYRDFLAGLMIAYVIDEPQSLAYINEDQLERWGLASHELHERALANLRRRTDDDAPYTTVGAGDQRLFIYSANDGYDAARLLLTETMAEWSRQVRGRLVIGIPNRDFLIAVGDGNPDILRAVAAQIQVDSQQRESGLTDQLFTFSGGQIRTYEWE